MIPTDPRRQLLRRLAWLCLVLLLLTTFLSAFIRLSQAGLGCADWPACYGQGARALQQRLGPQEADGAAVAAARLAHRVVASLALIVVIAMAWTAWARPPRLAREGVLALALLVLALALAALGIATPGARLPAVAMGNLLGGLLMLALCWRLAATDASATAGPVPGLGAWGTAGVGVVAVQIVLGALVSASFAALSCTDLAECTRAALAAGSNWQVLDPWRAPVFDAMQPVHRAGAPALWLHWLGAIVAVPVAVLLGATAWRRGRRREGGAVCALAIAQGTLGTLIVGAASPLVPVLLHNLAAALLLAALVRLV